MALRGVTSTRTVRLIALALGAVSLVQCAREAPSEPRVFGVRSSAPLFAKALQGPSVSSANPSYGDRGTTIDVQILGSGFTSGASATYPYVVASLATTANGKRFPVRWLLQ